MMNTDPEKNRAEYVQHLETQVQHLQRQLGELQAESRWIPQVSASMDPHDQTARVTLAFAGKNCTVTFKQDALRQASLNDVTTAALDSFMDNLVHDRFRATIEPEILRIMNGSKSVEGAGKW